MLLEHPPAHNTTVNVAFRIHAHSFSAAVLRGHGFHILDEILHGAVLCASDPYALLPSRPVRPPRFRVGNIDGVVARDRETAGPAELAPCRDVASFLIEDLDTVVVAVAYKQASL